MFSPRERYQWIEEYLLTEPPRASVDILNRDFVMAYSTDTGAGTEVTLYGAPHCRMLAKDLRAMYRVGRLKRSRSSIEGMGGMGFPTWVWGYRLP